MRKDLEKEYIILSEEFDMYFMRHVIELNPKLPRTSTVVVAVEGDDEFNAYSRSLVRNFNRKSVMEARKVDDTWLLTPLTRRARLSLAR